MASTYMENCNYNLVKLLLGKLDDAWRVEKHYLGDSDDENYRKVLEEIKADDEKHIEILKEEITRRIKEEKFD